MDIPAILSAFFVPKENVFPLDILCINSHSAIVCGLASHVSTEGKTVLNYAWMLAYQGHHVDMVSFNNGTWITNISENCSMPNLRFASGPELKPHYDICILHEGMWGSPPVEADFYIQFTFNVPSMTAESTVNPSAYPWAKGKRTIRCASMRGFDIYFPAIRKDFPVFPYPAPGKTLNSDFDRKEIVWTTKHIYGYDSNFQVSRFVTQQQIVSCLLFLFGRYGITHNMALQNVDYYKVYEFLSTSKISINAYFNGSTIESMLCGSLPLIWKCEIPGIPITNTYFLKEAEETGCLLYPSDGFQKTKEKIDRLMSDKDYYNMVSAKFSAAAEEYTFDGSYKVFKKLVGIE